MVAVALTNTRCGNGSLTSADKYRLVRTEQHSLARIGDMVDAAAWLFLPAALMCGAAYFGWSSLQGEYGLIAQQRLEQQIPDLTRDEQALLAERDRLTRLTEGLSGELIDMDLLDQKLRETFGYLRPDEAVLHDVN